MVQSDQDDEEIRLQVVFYRTAHGSEPVREWLKYLPAADKRIIGEDIKTVQFGFPVGMPLVRKLGTGLWEVRSSLPNRIARVIFTIEDGLMILLHGFIKKSQKTSSDDLQLARERLSRLRGEK
jgi:phage-related protein